MLEQAQCGRVVDEGACGNHLPIAGVAAAVAPNERLDLRAQCDRVDGLDDVIVRADVQAVYNVKIVLAGTDNDERCLDSLPAERLHCSEAVHAGKVHFHQNQGEGMLHEQ